jgi:hypothetical protein
MSRSSKKGHDHAWRRWIGVLGRSRTQYATLPASLPSLPCVPVDGGADDE